MKYKKHGDKKRISVWMALAVFFVSIVMWSARPASADSEAAQETVRSRQSSENEAVSEDAEQTEQPGDILVVSQDAPDSDTEDTVSALGCVLTAMGYRADFTTSRIYREDAGTFDETYDKIIWISSADPQEDGGAQCPDAAYKGKLLVLGSMPEKLVREKNLGEGIVFSEEKNGTAVYEFKGENTFSSAVCLEEGRLYESADYTSGMWQTADGTYPLAVGWGDLRNLILRDYTTDFAKAVLMQEITFWLWPYNDAPHIYSSCLVLDQVYPYTDPQRLLSVVEDLADRDMHFVVSVMPVYQHADYPAMQQFCEVLRYAQANGGAVILHSPIIQNEIEPDELQEKLTEAFESYTENGVYPIALSIPSDWIFQEDLRDTLGRYRTLFVEDTDAFEGKSGEELSAACKSFLSLGSQLYTPALSLDDTGISYLDVCATAVYVNIEEDDGRIARIIRGASASPVPMKSLWDMNQTVYTNRSHVLTWDGKDLVLDDQRVSLSYTAEKPEEHFDYKRNVYYRATADLSRSNVLLIIVSLAVVSMFVVMIWIARRQMNRQFLFRKIREPAEKAKSEKNKGTVNETGAAEVTAAVKETGAVKETAAVKETGAVKETEKERDKDIEEMKEAGSEETVQEQATAEGKEGENHVGS